MTTTLSWTGSIHSVQPMETRFALLWAWSPPALVSLPVLSNSTSTVLYDHTSESQEQPWSSQREGEWGTSLQNGGAWPSLRGGRPGSPLTRLQALFTPMVFTIRSMLWLIQGTIWLGFISVGRTPISPGLDPSLVSCCLEGHYACIHSRSCHYRKAGVLAINFKYSYKYLVINQGNQH